MSELERLRGGIVHVELGLEHVREGLRIVGPQPPASSSRIARVGRELEAGAAQLKTTLIMAGRLSPATALVSEAVPLQAVVPARVGDAGSAERRARVAAERVILNLSWSEGNEVLAAVDAALASGLKASKRDRLERVRALLEPRVARARRARLVA